MKKDIKTIIEMTCGILVGYILIDMFNMPSVILKMGRGYAVLLMAIILIYSLIKTGIINLLKINVENFIDELIEAGYISTLIYFAIIHLSEPIGCKLYVIGGIFIFLSILAIFRLIHLHITEQKAKKHQEHITVCDLQDVYNNNFNSAPQEIVFLEETAVGYDLLNRTKIIQDLYNSIKCCKTEKTFVISLTGEWGNGKTTLLNIVKEKLNKEEYIVIDDFEPWQYNNEKALIFAMFDKIMEQMGVKVSLGETRKFVEVCSAMLADDVKFNVNLLSSERKIMNNIKNTINGYLKTNNKRVVFIIDNIERTEANNILTIFKVISNILNLHRFIYVLSYDEKEMREIFNNKLQVNYDYVEKIVQLPLTTPKISSVDMMRICKQCMKNLLLHYGVAESEIDEYEPAIILFAKNIKDLRALKRKINSIVNSNFYNKGYLNVIDAFLINLIEFENSNLYDAIRDNYNCFVSVDKELVYGYKYQEAKDYNKELTDFFDNLFQEHKNKAILPILKLLFPKVKTYSEKRRNIENRIEFRSENSNHIEHIDKTIYKESILNKRIYNGRFFDLYFTRQSNAFIELDNRINEFIDKINSKKYDINNFEEVKDLQHVFSKLLFSYNKKDQKYLLETLELYLGKITKNKLLLVIILVEYQAFLSDGIQFLSLNARSRLEIICSELIKDLTTEELEILRKSIEYNYKNLHFIRKVLYWLNPKEHYGNVNNDEYYNKLTESYERLLDNVVKKNINIYENNNYSRRNLYTLIPKDRYKSQIKNINVQTVIRFLADMIGESVGSRYGYSLDTETLFKLKTYSEIDEMINELKKGSLTPKEELVISVYEKSKNKTNEFDSNTIYVDEYVDLDTE